MCVYIYVCTHGTPPIRGPRLCMVNNIYIYIYMCLQKRLILVCIFDLCLQASNNVLLHLVTPKLRTAPHRYAAAVRGPFFRGRGHHSLKLTVPEEFHLSAAQSFQRGRGVLFGFFCS